MPEDEVRLETFVDEAAGLLKAQFVLDYERHGDEWQHLPKEGQVERIYDRFAHHRGQHYVYGTPIPWLKIMGLAMIALVRERHPEALIP